MDILAGKGSVPKVPERPLKICAVSVKAAFANVACGPHKGKPDQHDCGDQHHPQNRPNERYCITRRGGASRTASDGRSGLCLNVNWLLGLKGMNREVLDGTVSFNARAAASNRTMKISASIATTFRSRQPNTRQEQNTPVHPKNCDRQHNLCAVWLLWPV